MQKLYGDVFFISDFKMNWMENDQIPSFVGRKLQIFLSLEIYKKFSNFVAN